MRSISKAAEGLILKIINSDEVDRRGRPLVPMSVKLDAAKFAWEVVHGKPTARQELDISVKLQGILSDALVQPGQGAIGALQPAVMDVESWEDDVEDSDEDELAG